MFPWGESHMQPEGSGIFVPPRFCHSHSCWNGPSNFWLLKCTFMQSKTGNEKAEVHSFRRQRVFGGWHFTGLCKTSASICQWKFDVVQICQNTRKVNTAYWYWSGYSYPIKMCPSERPDCNVTFFTESKCARAYALPVMYSNTHGIFHSIKMCRSERSGCNVTAYRNVAAYRNVLYCAQGAIKIICIIANLP